MHKQHSAFPSVGELDGYSTPLPQDENFGSSPLGFPSQSYVYNKKTHNGVKQKNFQKAGLSIKKEEPELARKRNELRAIREQIMLKRASVGLTSSSFAIDDPELCSDDEETYRPTESNERLQDERVTLPLQDRVKRILLHRGCSKVTQTRRNPIRHPQDHPLKFRVRVALQKRFMDPPVETPSAQIPMLEQDNQGFLRFLNILNKGVDMDKLRDIVNSATESESRPAQSNSQKGKDTNGVEDQPLPKKTDQQKDLKYILKTLGLSLDPDDMSKMADRTQERLYGGKKSTEEEKGMTRDKKPARHSGKKRSKERYSPGQYTRAGSATSSTSNRWSPAKSSSSSSRRHKSPQRSSRSQRRYRSPSLSPRRYRRSRSPYRRSRYSRSRSRDSSGDSSRDSYRDSRSPYSSYSPRSGDRWDPPHSYQSSTQPYPYPPPALPPPPQQYYPPPCLPPMYPPPGQYTTHSQYAAYYSYWGCSQTSVAWSNVPGQMPPPIMPPPIMPPVLPSPQTDPITSLLGPPPEWVEISKPKSKPDIFSNYKNNSRCLVAINPVEITDIKPEDKLLFIMKKEGEKRRVALRIEEQKEYRKNGTLKGNNVPDWSAEIMQQKRKKAVKAAMKPPRVQSRANQPPKKRNLKSWKKNQKKKKKKEKKKQMPAGVPQHIPLMEYIQIVPELNDDEVGEKPPKLKIKAFNSKKKKPSTQSAAAETKTELDDDEVEEKPSLTEEEIKANLKLKLEAFNSRMKKCATQPAETETELKPSLTEDEIKANLKAKLEAFSGKRKKGFKRPKKSKKANNI